MASETNEKRSRASAASSARSASNDGATRARKPADDSASQSGWYVTVEGTALAKSRLDSRPADLSDDGAYLRAVYGPFETEETADKLHARLAKKL